MFIPSYNKETDKIVSETITIRIHNELNDLFSGIVNFEGAFSLQVKEGRHMYQAPPRRVVYAFQQPLKEELEWLQKQQIIVLLSVDEMAEWCNTFLFSTQM